jgi:hypothetical protein
LGGRLETLCLDFKRLLETPPILYQLKDLPVLKRLVLKSVKFKLDALEEMHRNIPSIQDLSLDEMAVLKGNRPLDIIPATCMTRLKFSTVSIYDYRNNTLEGTISKETHGQFYQYIVKKYINITDIDYKDDALNSYQQDEIKHIYLNGLLDFFKLTVPIRNELTLSGLPDDVDPFEPLDSVDARINHLALVECSHESSIQYLYHSKQPDYIQDLHLLDTVLDSIHLLKDMPALTSLNVEYANSNTEPICVHGFLAACPPTLKSLAIAAKYLKTEPFNTKLDSIKSLSIGYGPLTSCLGDIISFCFPNLADLYVQGAVTENVNIKLMYPQFLTATFITGNPQLFGTNRNIAFSAHVLSFKSSNQAETQYYICDGRSNHNKPTKIQYADIVDLPILSVETCANIKVEVAVVNKVVLC